MKKLCMVIADADIAYIESVSAYFRLSHQWDEFDLKFFTTSQGLSDYILSHDLYDILLVSGDFLAGLECEHRKQVILLTEDKVLPDDQPAVFKFQPLDQLFSSVVSIYRKGIGRTGSPVQKETKTKVISVYSASGGSGKTTVAVHLSRQLALQNKKVFYLNFELNHSTPLFFSSPEPQQSSQILYHLKTHPQQVPSKIDSLKKYDPYAKVDFFDFVISPLEMIEMTETETETLIGAIAETLNYDAVIVDLDSSIHERTKAALLMSEQIYWLVSHDLQSFHKNAASLEAFDSVFDGKTAILDKTTFLLNKYSGQLAPEFSRYSLPLKHYLPYIPEWKSVSQSSPSPAYQKAVQTIISLEDSMKGGVAVD